ncbi:uncharacterized protein WM294_017102 [Sarcoramphus papa]
MTLNPVPPPTPVPPTYLSPSVQATSVAGHRGRRQTGSSLGRSGCRPVCPSFPEERALITSSLLKVGERLLLPKPGGRKQRQEKTSLKLERDPGARGALEQREPAPLKLQSGPLRTGDPARTRPPPPPPANAAQPCERWRTRRCFVLDAGSRIHGEIQPEEGNIPKSVLAAGRSSPRSSSARVKQPFLLLRLVLTEVLE